jgi:hypothetical protein
MHADGRMRSLENRDAPGAGDLIAFDLKGGEGSDGSCLNSPERTSPVVGAIDAIADAIPPPPCLAPSRQNTMDAKTPASEGELHWGRPIGQDFMGANLANLGAPDGRGLIRTGLLGWAGVFEHMFEK